MPGECTITSDFPVCITASGILQRVYTSSKHRPDGSSCYLQTQLDGYAQTESVSKLNQGANYLICSVFRSSQPVCSSAAVPIWTTVLITHHWCACTVNVRAFLLYVHHCCICIIVVYQWCMCISRNAGWNTTIKALLLQVHLPKQGLKLNADADPLLLMHTGMLTPSDLPDSASQHGPAVAT